MVESFIELQQNTADVLGMSLLKGAGNVLKTMNLLKNRVEVKIALTIAMAGLLTACGSPAAVQSVDQMMVAQATLTPFMPGVEPTVNLQPLTNPEAVPVQPMEDLQMPPTAQSAESVQAQEQVAQQNELSVDQDNLFTKPTCKIIRPGNFDQKAAEGARQARFMMAEVVDMAAADLGLSLEQVDALKRINIRSDNQPDGSSTCQFRGAELSCAPEVLISNTTNALLAHEFIHMLMAELGFSPSGQNGEFAADLFMGSEFPDTHHNEINRLDIANCTGSNYLWTGIDGSKRTIQQILIILKGYGVTDDLVTRFIMSGGQDSATQNSQGVSIDSATSQWFERTVAISAWWDGYGRVSLDPSLYYNLAEDLGYEIFQSP